MFKVPKHMGIAHLDTRNCSTRSHLIPYKARCVIRVDKAMPSHCWAFFHFDVATVPPSESVHKFLLRLSRRQPVSTASVRILSKMAMLLIALVFLLPEYSREVIH